MSPDIINRDALAQLLTRIDQLIATGVNAQAYDGDGAHSSGRPDSHPERVALNTRPDTVSDKANNDLHALRQAAATLEKIAAAYPPVAPGQHTLPGITTCPPGRCADCWRAGVNRPASKKRYSTLCRRCGDHRKRNGYPIPPEAIRALAANNGDWSSWAVQRALRARTGTTP